MYKQVFNTYDSPCQLEHAIGLAKGQGASNEDLQILVGSEGLEYLNGKLVEPEIPEPVEVAEGEEAPEPEPLPDPAPAFDELNLKLWQKLKNEYSLLVAGPDGLEGGEEGDEVIANSYRTYLDNGKIVLIVKEWTA